MGPLIMDKNRHIGGCICFENRSISKVTLRCKSCFFFNVSNEENPGWLGYIGDDILPSYIGIIINHYKDPY